MPTAQNPELLAKRKRKTPDQAPSLLGIPGVSNSWRWWDISEGRQPKIKAVEGGMIGMTESQIKCFLAKAEQKDICQAQWREATMTATSPDLMMHEQPLCTMQGTQIRYTHGCVGGMGCKQHPPQQGGVCIKMSDGCFPGQPWQSSARWEQLGEGKIPGS